MKNLIVRSDYTERIKPFIGKPIIKVLTGQRRVGKSCILQQLQQHIRENVPSAHILYINKELEDFAFIRTHDDLTQYVKSRLQSGVPNFLFIDEVQDVAGFERTLRSLQAAEACDIFITGSNATMLSSELSTYLSGRYVEFHIFSLNYKEFLQFHDLSSSTSSLRAYLTYGGLPYLRHLPLQEDVAFEYLRNVYATIFLKDVVKREGIRNVDFLERLSAYVADNVGSLFSANNISKYLKSQRVNISPLQVINYLKALQHAFLVSQVQRLDIVGLKKFEIGEKYFFEDLGLRNCGIGFTMQRDIQKLIENAIYLHLRGRHFDVYTGQLSGGREVDFVARRRDEKVYVQATYLLDGEETRRREFGNLQAIRDNYPKYVVSLDEWTAGSHEHGIAHVHLADFLSSAL